MDKKRAEEKLTRLKTKEVAQEFEDDSDDFEDALDDEEEFEEDDTGDEPEEADSGDEGEDGEEEEVVAAPKRGRGRPPGSRGRPDGSAMPSKFQRPVKLTLEFETVDIKTVDGVVRALKGERYRY